MNKLIQLLWFMLFLYSNAIGQDSLLAPEDPVHQILPQNVDTLTERFKTFSNQHLYVEAITPAIKLIELSLENEDGNRAHYYRFQLAKIYTYLGWYSNALVNLEYCQVYYHQNQNNVDYVKTCHLLSLVNYKINNMEMAKYFFDQTVLEKPTNNNPYLLHEHLMLECLINPLLEDLDIKTKLSKVIKFARENDLLDLQAQSYLILGDLYSKTNIYIQACIAYEKSLALCNLANFQFDKAQLCLKIYECLAHQELYKEANKKLLQYIGLSDSLSKIKQDEALLKSINKFDDKSLREEKIDLAQEKRFFELKSRRSNITLIGLLFGIGFILLAVFLIILFYQQKLNASNIILKQNEQINNQKIKELEQSITLNNLESMIKGQEEERERIAKDLHDSLGGLLSTIKLRYDKLIYENAAAAQSYEQQKVHELIDEACSEIRNISHDLKPGALEKLGLIDSIQDMLNRYDQSGINIIFQHYGFNHEENLDSETTIYAYRIIQELVNNSVKHSLAKEILVQLNMNEEQFEIIVEDDGKGYDNLTIKKGMGLENIKSRVNYLKGELSVKSELNNGTSTYVVIPTSKLIRS